MKTKPAKFFKVPAEDEATDARHQAGNDYRGGSYDENGNYRSDDPGGRAAAAGKSVGATSGSEAAPASEASWATATGEKRAGNLTRSTLPCQPQVIDDGLTTYYVCGKTYYQLSYGADGPIYTPVATP